MHGPKGACGQRIQNRLRYSHGVHSLLDHERLSSEEAHARCDRYLGTRWKYWRVARLLLPREPLADLIALTTWHELVRDLMSSTAPEIRLRDLDELVSVLERAFSEEGNCAIGIALERTVRLHRLPALLFRGPLEEFRRCEQVSAFETRGELLAHARRISQPQGRMLLSIGDLASERNEILADALGVGIQLTRWLTELAHDLRRGRLHFAVEDVVRHGVDIRELTAGRIDARSRELVADQIAWTRSFFEKGWPLCQELGRWRGRQLAFLLRWYAAALSAIEARRYDALSGPPPAGLLRLMACGTVSLATPGAPRFSA